MRVAREIRSGSPERVSPFAHARLGEYKPLPIARPLLQPQSLHTGLQQRPSPHLCRVGSHIVRFRACSAFTRVTACLLAESPKATLSIEGFGSFVASTVAPITTGRSDSLPGGNCTTENVNLITTHKGDAQRGHH